MRTYVRGLLLVTCALGAQDKIARKQSGAQPAIMPSFNMFVCDIARYYCDAGWICKSFETMPLPYIVDSWQQLVMLMTSREHQWFYAYDSVHEYDERCARFHRTYETYVRDSVDAYWLAQCAQYHQFFTNNLVDMQSGVVCEKTRDYGKTREYDKKRYNELVSVLWAVAPDATRQFYAFYFEQLANALYKKLNYVYENSEVESAHILGIADDKKLLKRLYMLCVHQNGAACESLASKLAYHYRRIDEVYMMVNEILFKRLGL